LPVSRLARRSVFILACVLVYPATAGRSFQVRTIQLLLRKSLFQLALGLIQFCLVWPRIDYEQEMT